MRKTILSIALVSIFSSSAAFSHTVSKTYKHTAPQWNTVELGYTISNIRDTDGLKETYFNNIDPDGFSLRASTLVNKDVFVIGEVISLSDEYIDVDAEALQASAGVGYIFSVSKYTDAYSAVSYRYIEGESPIGEFDESGYGLTLGLKSMITDHAEVGVEIDHMDVGDYERTSLRGEAGYYVSKEFALTANYEFSDDFDIMSLVIKYAF
jgi:hypothetical protein